MSRSGLTISARGEGPISQLKPDDAAKSSLLAILRVLTAADGAVSARAQRNRAAYRDAVKRAACGVSWLLGRGRNGAIPATQGPALQGWGQAA